MGKKYVYLGIAFIAFVLFLSLGNILLKPKGYSNVAVLNDGWNVTYNDKTYEDVQLSMLRRIVGSGSAKGDRIVFTKEGVNLRDYVSPTIMFESRFSEWTVYANSKKVDERFIGAYKNNRFIGCENNFVALPRSYSPVTVEIDLLVTEEGAYNFYEAPAVGGYFDLLVYEVYKHMFIYLISAFLIVFGIVFFAVAVGFRSEIAEMNMQIYSALLYIVLGTWLMTQFKLLDLFIETNGHQTEIEYISLYMVVPIMYVVIGCMRDFIKKKIFLIFAITGSVIPFILIFIHFAGITHINQTLAIYQIDGIVLIVFMVVMLLRNGSGLKEVTIAQYVQIVGQGALGVSFLFNVLFYYLEIIGVSEQIMLSKLAVPMGAMCMVFATLLNYYTFISESYARQKEYTSLAHLAYADELTGLANRARYDSYMSSINKEDDYCIVSIDLNGLKTINDNMGHLSGDKYLTEFAEGLKETFGQIGFVARIGGDEFVAILKRDVMTQVEEYATKLNNYLDDLNKEDSSIHRSAAIGYAYKHEYVNADSNMVYLKADERMYNNKELMHGTSR